MADTADSSQEVQLYVATLNEIPKPMSTLLEAYSNIPPSSQISHVLGLRNRAYTQHPYPCLGRFRFLDLDFSTHPLYQSHIVPLLANKSDTPIFLDLGTCLGQDIRKLIFDTQPALPPKHLYGADLLPEFIDIGYELFRDESKLPRSQFIAPADLFDTSPSNTLSALDGKVGILHISAVFHLFGLEAQVEVARRCLRLLDSSGLDLTPVNGGSNTAAKKALICGSQTANITAGNYSRGNGSSRWRHNETSWRELWEGVVADPEWKGKIRSVEVESRLMERGFKTGTSSDSDAAVRDENQENDVDETGGGSGRRKQIGSIEAGFRWMVWWVWVEFV